MKGTDFLPSPRPVFTHYVGTWLVWGQKDSNIRAAWHADGYLSKIHLKNACQTSSIPTWVDSELLPLALQHPHSIPTASRPAGPAPLLPELQRAKPPWGAAGPVGASEIQAEASPPSPGVTHPPTPRFRASLTLLSLIPIPKTCLEASQNWGWCGDMETRVIREQTESSSAYSIYILGNFGRLRCLPTAFH